MEGDVDDWFQCVLVRDPDLRRLFAVRAECSHVQPHRSVVNSVFVKRGKSIGFRKESDLHASGIVVEADRIRGKLATCRIKSRKEDGDMINMVAACATDIMLSDVQFSVQVIDDNNAQTPFDG